MGGAGAFSGSAVRWAVPDRHFSRGDAGLWHNTGHVDNNMTPQDTVSEAKTKKLALYHTPFRLLLSVDTFSKCSANAKPKVLRLVGP